MSPVRGTFVTKQHVNERTRLQLMDHAEDSNLARVMGTDRRVDEGRFGPHTTEWITAEKAAAVSCMLAILDGQPRAGSQRLE